jgi:hypothetical protein
VYTVAEMKDLLAEKTGHPVDYQHMVFNGQELENNRTLEHYQIGHESTVCIVFK